MNLTPQRTPPTRFQSVLFWLFLSLAPAALLFGETFPPLLFVGGPVAIIAAILLAAGVREFPRVVVTDHSLLVLQNALLVLASASLCVAGRQRLLGQSDGFVVIEIVFGLALLTLLFMVVAWRRDGVWFCWEDVPVLLVKVVLGMPLLTAVMIAVALRPQWLASGPGSLLLLLGMALGLAASVVLPDRLVEWARRSRTWPE